MDYASSVVLSSAAWMMDSYSYVENSNKNSCAGHTINSKNPQPLKEGNILIFRYYQVLHSDFLIDERSQPDNEKLIHYHPIRIYIFFLNSLLKEVQSNVSDRVGSTTRRVPLSVA